LPLSRRSIDLALAQRKLKKKSTAACSRLPQEIEEGRSRKENWGVCHTKLKMTVAARTVGGQARRFEITPANEE
jgi:hypothetical protein